MKAEAQFNVDLSRLCEVRAAERVGAVQQESPVGQIHRLQGKAPVVAEGLAKCKTKRRMAWEMIRPVAIEKARAVADVSGDVGACWKIDGKARAQCMTLIVIKEEEVCRWRKISEPAGHSTLPLQSLVRISQVELAALKELWRTHGNFEPAHSSALDRQREKDVRVAKGVMVEKVLYAGAEIVCIDGPALYGNRDPELSSSSRSPRKGIKSTPCANANCSNGPVMVESGGA